MVDYYLTSSTWNYEPEDMVEGFKSLIWTERYNASGDFVLTMPYNHPLIPKITTEKFLLKSNSRHFMQIEKYEKDKSAGTITFKGRSADSILNYRVTVRETLWPKWSITGTPIATAMELVRRAIDQDWTYYTAMGFPQMYVTDSSGNPGASTKNLIPIDYTYNLMKSFCDSVNVGFRFMHPLTNSDSLVFEFYKGVDRSASQNDRPAIMFDPELDNLEDVKSIFDTTNYIPRLWAHHTYYDNAIADNYYYETYYNNEPYYRPNTLPGGAWEVRYMHYDLEGVYDPTVNVPADVWTMYKAELAKKKVAVSIDGKIVPTKSSFTAGVDYFLGDMVSYRLDADTVDARVTEIIYSHDIEGERVYPTLSFANDTAEV